MIARIWRGAVRQQDERFLVERDLVASHHEVDADEAGVDERGHHRCTIDPAADNTPAIRAYEKVGFRPVGVMRGYWRSPSGEWRDGLLMDLLAPELDRTPMR